LGRTIETMPLPLAQTRRQLRHLLAAMPNNQLGVHAQQSLGQAAPMGGKNSAPTLLGTLEVDVKFVHSLHAFL
jgi:hypothetical protein